MQKNNTNQKHWQSENIIYTTSGDRNSIYSHPKNRVNFILLKWGQLKMILNSRWLLGTSMTSRIFTSNITLKRYCMICFDREDTLECPAGQKAPWGQSLVGTLCSIFTVCDSWFQTLVGTCSFQKGHLMLRNHRQTPAPADQWLRPHTNELSSVGSKSRESS